MTALRTETEHPRKSSPSPGAEMQTLLERSPIQQNLWQSVLPDTEGAPRAAGACQASTLGPASKTSLLSLC